MNSKQLTNILVKIVGLDLCGHAAPALCYAFWIWFQNMANLAGPGLSVPMRINVSTVSVAQPLLSVALGVFLIMVSRVVTNWLFNNEPQEP